MTNASERAGRMPAIFFGHGSPMVTVGDNAWTRAWRAIGESIDAGAGRPRAVLMVSAHWTTRGTAVTAMTQPRTIHDFGGFPPELHAIGYPAPGAPWLAAGGRTARAAAGGGGWNEGWIMALVGAAPRLAAGGRAGGAAVAGPGSRRLAPGAGAQAGPLRDEGVLIAGSGNVVHNLRAMDWSDPDRPPFDWAARFEEWVRARLRAGDADALADYAAQGRDALMSVPTPEHYLPLLYVAAQRLPGEPVSFPAEGDQHGAISMLGVRIG
jgi:4,5-DOPA dioxygenase extradiol